MLKLVREENFIGYVYDIIFEKVLVNILENLKDKNGGLAENTLLLAKNKTREDVILLRLRGIAPSTMGQKKNESILLEHFANEDDSPYLELDIQMKKEMNFTNYTCDILGTISNEGDRAVLSSDIDTFYPAHNYVIYKPEEKELEEILKIAWDVNNLEKGDMVSRYGTVRYASTNFEKGSDKNVPFYLKASDLLARRSALFGMTRTWKSNSLKKLIDTMVDMSKKNNKAIGQIIFDVNGEYAFKNSEDEISIKDKYSRNTIVYTFSERKVREAGAKMMKLNFYNEGQGLREGFGLIKLLLAEISKSATYFKSFLNVDLEEPDQEKRNEVVRYERKLRLYQAILYTAWFEVVNENQKYRLKLAEELREQIGYKDNKGPFTLAELKDIFEKIWSGYNTLEYFEKYKKENPWKEWADEDLKSLLIILTRKKEPGSQPTVDGYTKLKPLTKYHTWEPEDLFTAEIIKYLTSWKIVIVDLSTGEDEIKKVYSEMLTKEMFEHNKNLFINGTEKEDFPCFQLYFEEAHNLFPTGDSDLTQIYNRLAKEWAKYRLGLVYATQEVSSISSNILKNTENWFLSHLNNDLELNVLNGYFDFKVYSNSLKRFSKATDLWYSRIKMLSYPFTLPIQIDLFQKDKKDGVEKNIEEVREREVPNKPLEL